MIERYEGEDNPLLIEAVRVQRFVEGDLNLASEIAAVAILEEVKSGQHLVEQAATDNDLILIISGSTSIYVNQRKVAARRTGQHVGRNGPHRRDGSALCNRDC
jgi:hypothetical protein